MNRELQDRIFQLHSSCQLIEGFEQSIIYDIQRCTPYYIPNDFNKFLNYSKGKKLKSFILKNEDYKDHLKEVEDNINYLLDNDLGFYLDKDELAFFPPLSLDYFPHKIIGNTIIHLSDKNTSFFEQSVHLLNQLQHPNIEVWYDFSGDFEFLELVLTTMEKNDFYSYNLHLNISDMNISTLKVHDHVKKHFKVRNAYFYNTTYQPDENTEKFLFIKKPFKFHKNQTTISASNFNINISLFTESQKHNTYSNRKLYIGKNGEIKNAPECSDWFGFIQNTTLEELKDIIAMPNFQKYWYVHKELIDVCKGCEFRHMCVDNRVPLKRKTDEWYHQTECNYNPYISKWQGEEGYKTLEDCGVVSDENGMQINHKQLEEINAQLWED